MEETAPGEARVIRLLLYFPVKAEWKSFCGINIVMCDFNAEIFGLKFN